MVAAEALATLPAGLRKALLDAFTEIVRNFRERRWEPSELNGGKLCEAAYTILKGHVDGKIPNKAAKPRNMLDACKALESTAAGVTPRSVRIQIPRMLVALYEIRNNRGVGHVGGDVDPNHMDAKVVLESAKWIMAELVRVFHGVDVDEATQVVEGLTERTVPVVWEIGDKKRVLQPGLSMKEQTLLLLFSSNGPINQRELIDWVEHSNASVYRRDVLRTLHKARLVNFDESSGDVEISPTGIAYVEDSLPLEMR